MRLRSKSMQVRPLGRRLFNVFKFLAIKNPAQEAGFFMILNYLKKVQVDLGLSL
jgi:hypothetical protein